MKRLGNVTKEINPQLRPDIRLLRQVRSDLPGYLADSEADNVCVINYYHKQFKHAAKKRSHINKIMVTECMV